MLLLENRLDLRTRSVHDHQPDAEAVQKVEVVDDAQKGVVGDDLSANRDHESLAAKSVNVRRGRAYPLHERPCRGGIGGGIDARGSGHRNSGWREAGAIITSVSALARHNDPLCPPPGR